MVVFPAVDTGLGYFSKVLLYSVFVLIFVGALVTSNQAGLAVPDWPTTYGENMFLFPYHKWQGGIFYEHGHRLLASGVGFLTVLLFIWTALVDRRRWVKGLTALALLTVIVQGILGGMTVLYLLPAWLSTAHAILAQTFLALTVLIAYAHSTERLAVVPAAAGRNYRLAVYGLLLVYVQLFLGAYMRHTYSGLAIPDFPTTAGSWVPRFDSAALAFVNNKLQALGQWTVSRDQMIIHFLHRAGGVLVALYFIFFCRRIICTSDMPVQVVRNAWTLMVLVCIQFILGVLAVVTVKEPVLTSVHVVVGAIFLSFTVLMVGRLFVVRG